MYIIVYQRIKIETQSFSSLKISTDGRFTTHHLSQNSYVMTTNDKIFMHLFSMVDGHEVSQTKIHVIRSGVYACFTHCVGFCAEVWSLLAE